MTTVSESPAVATRGGRSLDGPWPVVLLLAGHFAFLALFFAPAISTPDANGYMAQARLIAREGRTDIVVESPAQYVGDHWMPVGEGHYYGRYPPGLPALQAVVFRTLGAYASLWVLPVMGTSALLGLYLVVRAWAGPRLALFAAVLMAVNPFANQHALGADSHTAVCFFLIWALYGLVRWETSRSPAWAGLVGLCLGMIPTIRYAEALFLIPFALYMLLSPPRDARRPLSLLVATAAAGVPLVALAYRNQIAFQAFWRTGYSVSGEQTGFGPGYFIRHAPGYIFLLFLQGVWIVFPFGVLGMRALCREPETLRRGRLLVGLVLPITLLYMAYYWQVDSHSMRFLLPTFSLYTIAAVLLLSHEQRSDPAKVRRHAKLILGLTLAWGLPYSIFALGRLKRENGEIAHVTRLVEAKVSPGDVLIAQSGLQQHLDFLGRWRLAPEEAFDRHARPPRPLGPGHFAERRRRPDTAEIVPPAERTAAFRAEIARWARRNGSDVYWLTTEERLQTVRERLGPSDDFTRIGEVEVPRRPGPPPGGFPDGPGTRGGPPEKGRDRPGPPAHYRPPDDGRFVLVRWTIREPATASDGG